MISRRSFVEWTGKAAATLAVGPRVALAQQETPHFFLHVFVKEGADATYLFDARDQRFTDKGWLQNYRSDRGVHLWEDGRGGKTWVSSLAQALVSERSEMTVLNGVHMARGFDGHPQNIAFMATGAPTGGRLFVTDFPRPAAVPLSFLAQGRFEGVETPSMEVGVSLKPTVARKLAQRFQGIGAIDAADPGFAFVRGRAAAVAGLNGGVGAMARGAAQLGAGLDGAGAIIETQKRIRLCADGGEVACDPRFLVEGTEASAMRDGLKAAGEYFTQGMTRNALLSVRYDLDAHDATQARNQEQVVGKVVEDLKALFAFLRMPFDEARGLSFGDVTTVLVTSEFSRTMRQMGAAIDDTGTDHNPFTNTVLLAGKGVKKGLVVGATDMAALGGEGELVGISGAHRQVDPDLVKLVGRPFDHATMQVTELMPERYEDGHYLSFLNVINTLYALFGVGEEHHKAFSRTGPKAAVVRGLLV